MATYYFKNKGGTESISVTSADTLQEATEYFAGIKRLSLADFEKLYEVKLKLKTK